MGHGQSHLFLADRVELVYRYAHNLIAGLVAEINPALSPDQVEIVSVYISSSIEGSTMLAGYSKPWRRMMPQINGIASTLLASLIRDGVNADAHL